MDLLSDFRLLVVDDDMGTLHIVKSMMPEGSSKVLYGSDGLSGYSVAKEEIPDLILMDWHMPRMNGIDAIKKLKADPETQDIPIIVATGIMTSADDLSLALDVGAVDFLRKPFEKAEFVARIQSILRTTFQNRQIRELLTRERDLMKESSELKDRELSNMMAFEMQKNSLLEQLLKQLERLNSVTNFSHTTTIKQIQKDIKSQVELKNEWDQFQIRFQKVHPQFFDDLSTRYQDLTVNEKKYSAYLKMGLDNHEISVLTGISQDSVRKVLYRLKKKFNLNQEEDLRSFVQAFPQKN